MMTDDSRNPSHDTFDPEAPMLDFRARTSPTTTRISAAGSGENPTHDPPPFGTRRGDRIAYTVNLPADLADRLESTVRNTPAAITYGTVAVDAIRTHWQSIQSDLPGGDDRDPLFPLRRINEGRLAPRQGLVRKVFYITVAEAEAIAAVMELLGNIEIGQLHRLALERHLDSPAA